VLAILLWRVLSIPPRAIATLAAIAAAIIIARIPTYIVVTLGRVVTADAKSAFCPPPKESRWFLILLVSLVALILTILVWSVWSSLKRRHLTTKGLNRPERSGASIQSVVEPARRVFTSALFRTIPLPFAFGGYLRR
jgi:hypothetical protein